MPARHRESPPSRSVTSIGRDVANDDGASNTAPSPSPIFRSTRPASPKSATACRSSRCIRRAAQGSAGPCRRSVRRAARVRAPIGLRALVERPAPRVFLDTCERVLAGGVSRWGNDKNRRRRRKPEGRPETPPGAAVGDVSPAQARDGAASAARRGSRVRVAGAGDHGGAGRAMAGSVSGRGPGQPEEPGAGRLGRGESSAASQDR